MKMQLETLSGVMLAVQVLILAMRVTPLHCACELCTCAMIHIDGGLLDAVKLSVCYQNPLLAIL